MKAIKEVYDKESKVYDFTRAIFEKGRFALRERKLLSNYIPKRSRVLVVACGTGRHHKFLINELACEVIGLDLSIKMLTIARSKVKTELVAGVAEYLPFREGIFDAVICSRALYLFADKRAFLKEAYSVLRRFGCLCVSTVSKGLRITRLLIALRLLVSDPTSYPYNAKDLARMLNEAGFNKVETRCIVMYTNGISRFIPRLFLTLIEILENHLKDGRWVMAVGRKDQAH